LKQFLELKIIENNLKSAARCWAEIGPRLQHVARRPTTHDRQEDQLGHGLAARSSSGDALAGGPVVASERQGLGLKHHGRAADAPARGAEAGLTDVVARWRGRAAARCGGVLVRGSVGDDSG
jgi:hypothetical protein